MLLAFIGPVCQIPPKADTVFHFSGDSVVALDLALRFIPVRLEDCNY
jgi:hypothetical protein